MYACSRVWNKIHRTCSPLNLSLFNPQRDVRVLRARSVQHDEIHHFAQGAVDLMEKRWNWWDFSWTFCTSTEVYPLVFHNCLPWKFAEIVGNYHLQMGNYHWLGTHPATFFGSGR